MIKFLNLQPEVFGMDINDSSIKIVNLKKKRAGFKLSSVNEVTLAPGTISEGAIKNSQALAEAIAIACKTVKGRRLASRYVAVSLPEEKSFSQVIQMPKMTPRELRLAVPFEAENYIPIPTDKAYLDFQAIAPHEHSEQHIDVLINAMPKSVVNSYVACLKEAGLTPCVLELESQAVVRALMKTGTSLSSTIFIDFGQASATFIIFSGDSIRFTSSMPFSSQQLTQAIAKNLGVSLHEAEKLKIKYGLSEKKEKPGLRQAMEPILADFVEQIKKYIGFYQGHVSHDYFSSQGSIGRIVLCGGGANLKKLPEFLSEKLKISVELGNPLTNIIYDKKKSEYMPLEKALSFTKALGLALRGANYEM